MRAPNDANQVSGSPIRHRNRLLACLACLCAGIWGTDFASSPTQAQSFQIREPRELDYQVAEPSVTSPLLESRQEWIQARRPGSNSSKPSSFGKRLVIQTGMETHPEDLLIRRPLALIRQLAPNLIIAEAKDAWTALRECQSLLLEPGVLAVTPVVRHPFTRSFSYAPQPDDPYFFRQWNLENRDPSTGSPLGVDLNVRAAWAMTRGGGVTVAVADDGTEMAHPDLRANLQQGPHFNFFTRTEDGSHTSVSQAHGTAIAGLISATANNRVGMSGIAPESQLASWVIWNEAGDLISTDVTMEMFQFASNRVAVQNHSWANGDSAQVGPTLLEQIGISNAVHQGRNGLGVVIVRASGNGRGQGLNANDDGFGADPQVIAVGAVRFDGRVASYSMPGANVLVAAPSGDFDAGQPSIFTTDRLGTVGYNNNAFANDLGDYAFDGSGFSGTSASTPQIAAVAALALSINPALGYRDVQQILALASHQTDSFDEDVRVNGAGLTISHNTGFGVPDAGEVVRLAKNWINRPPQTSVEKFNNETIPIPDDSLHVFVSGTGVTPALASIPATPGTGAHPDEATLDVPLVDVGQALGPIGVDLRGKAALIQRGGNLFTEKLRYAHEAGALFAVIYDNRSSSTRVMMDTDFEPIPGVFLTQANGEALKKLVNSGQVIRVHLATSPATYEFPVAETLICEQVVATVDTDHSRRGDLRITLVSPSGTRSVLQRLNSDAEPGPIEWSYMSVLNLLEPSAGVWRVEVTDEAAGRTGNLRSVRLKILGTPIEDTDRDGLDDDFERRFFGDLSQGPKDDPDRDGFNNAREQVMRTDPMKAGRIFSADLTAWNSSTWRLSWPSKAGDKFEVLSAPEPSGPFTLITKATGQFPESSVFLKQEAVGRQFLQIRNVTP